MSRWLEILFSGVQAISALVLMVLALWAAFFTSLPEVLVSQLRSEITEAKSEITELRDQKNSVQAEYMAASSELTRLKLESEALVGSIDHLREELTQKEEKAVALSVSNNELLSQRVELEQVISVLRLEQSELEANLSVLREERAVYAGQTLDFNLSKVAAYACYRLSAHRFDSSVASNYGDHRNWLNANRRLEKLQAAYDALSIQEKYSDDNQLAVEYRRLQDLAGSVPDIWFGLPTEPNLVPDAQPRLLGPHAVRLLNSVGGEDYESLHRYLIRLFFDRTVQSENVRELTAATFIEEMAALPFLGDLLDQERTAVKTVLMNFIYERPSLRDMVINTVYRAEPSAAEIPKGAHLVIANQETLRDELSEFFASHGISTFGECSL